MYLYQYIIPFPTPNSVGRRGSDWTPQIQKVFLNLQFKYIQGLCHWGDQSDPFCLDCCSAWEIMPKTPVLKVPFEEVKNHKIPAQE
jgi:hypothetical protein